MTKSSVLPSYFRPPQGHLFSASELRPANISIAESQIRTPRPLKPTNNDPISILDSQVYHAALAQLQQSSDSCMNGQQQYRYLSANPDIQVQQYNLEFFGSALRQDSLLTVNQALDEQDWFSHPSMGGPSVTTQGLTRARSGHQRTPSASTVASNGPASPYTHNYSNPQIANTDFAPNSPARYPEQQPTFCQKTLLNQRHTPIDSVFSNEHIPSQAAHTGAHQAMKGFAIDHHTGEDFAPAFTLSDQGMSSTSYTSPDTPNSGAGETTQGGQYSLPQNGETGLGKGGDMFDYLQFRDADYVPANPDVQLFRTDSQAYQDELYNPDVPTSAPVASSTTKSTTNYLSPHRGLMEQRLQTANMNRSQSPNSSAMSRDRSPFRAGSPLAPTGTGHDWQSQTTAASMRQQQKEQADRAEITRHQPQLRREPTKTISPKDALLDYTEQGQPSLFQDTVPSGYQTHTGGTQLWSSNDYQPGGSFGSLQTPSQQHQFSNFRATPVDTSSAATNTMNYVSLPPQDQSQLQTGSFLNSYLDQSKMESNPEFPANLTRMESSISDNGPSASQESAANGTTSAPRRPTDTRAGTGTYTCTYHGCTQRFDSHQSLQKHKREYHRSQQHHLKTESPASASPADGSASPRSSESPEPSNTGMTSAALMARNSQAGPHKCIRINPSTGKPCNTIFSRPYDLTRHEDTIHNKRKQKVRCPMCREEKTFSRNDALTRHMRVVHPEVESFGKRSRKGD